MPVGRTKDAGWEIGVSRTLPITPQEAWARIEDPAGDPKGSGQLFRVSS